MSAVSTWRTVRLDDVCDINPPKSGLRGVDDDTEVMFVPMSAVDERTGTVARPEHSTVGAVGRKSFRSFCSGDVLFAKITPSMENGKAALVPELPNGLGFGSTEFHVLRPKAGTEPRLLWHLVRQPSFRAEAVDHFTGTVGQLRVPPDFLKSYEVMLPTGSADQSRLADILDASVTLASSAASHCEAARRAVVRFRQAVLSAACTGRLTADWRESNADEAKPIAAELRQLSGSSRRPAGEPDSVWLPEDTPATWEPATLDWLVDRIEAGKSVRAHGHAAGADEWGVIKVSAMSWGRFLEGENKALLDTSRANPDYEIRPGDLLISRANTVDLVGATVLVGETRSRLLLSDKSLRLITMPGVDRAWLNYCLRSPLVRAQFAERATGTSDSMRNLSQDKILMTTLLLPPSTEQVEIARRATELLGLADELESRISSAIDGIDRGSQGVVARAFRGELNTTGSPSR